MPLSKKSLKKLQTLFMGYSKFLNLDHCFHKDIESVNIYFALLLRKGKTNCHVNGDISNFTDDKTLSKKIKPCLLNRSKSCEKLFK